VSVALGVLLPLIFVLYSGSVRLLGLFSQMRLLPKGGSSMESWLGLPTVNRIIRTASHFIPVDRDWVRDQSMEILQGIVEHLSKLIATFLAGMPGLLLAIFVVIISVFFFLVDGAKFLRFLSSLSPLQHDRSVELYGAFEKSCRGVVLGLFASALLQGLLMAVFFGITGLPSIPLVAIVTVIMGMVPVVGSAPIWIGASLYLFANHSPILGLVMIFGGFIISTSDNLVRAGLMKGHSEMHPLLALVSVFGAVNLMGPTGIFLGPVIAAVFVSFLRILAVEIRRENTVGGETGGEEVLPVPSLSPPPPPA
jgi:predicted PurR-regulated permease PerM